MSEIQANPLIDRLINLFRQNFSERNVFVIRVPGRVNLLGTHVDHRGGCLNYVALDRNFWIVGSKRTDSKTVAVHLSPAYEKTEFDIRENLPDASVEWETAIKNYKISHHWTNYIKSPFVFLQHKMPEKRLIGCNLACWGDIPQAAGLSSSSAVVTASMIAACFVNNIELSEQQLIEYAGRSEWFVGTRGGWGDHAAMILCRKNKICHMQFYPFKFEYFPFFKDTKIILINSMIEAKKSAAAKGIFNERIASYEIGFQLLKRKCGNKLQDVQRIRDINSENFKNAEEIYDLLLSIPETITRHQLLEIFADSKDWLETIFNTHPDPGIYRIRDVVSYGIFECERSRICKEFLLKGDAENFGNLMFISHDGDRVTRYEDGKEYPWAWHMDDHRIFSLKQKIKNHQYDWHIHLQPGHYACSTKEIDFIVDCLKEIPGVYGAKITGAGLGGCVVVLAQNQAVTEVKETITQRYFKKIIYLLKFMSLIHVMAQQFIKTTVFDYILGSKKK